MRRDASKAVEGSPVSGSNPVYRAPEETAQIKCTPITLYQSEPPAPEFLGAQIAACGEFISYAIKGGKIRVLARGSATRTLLRGHRATIVDLALASVGEGAARLASCCAAGALVGWDVREAAAADEVEASHALYRPDAGASRATWRPRSKASELAVAAGDGASVLDVAHDGTAIAALPHGARVLDLRWSDDGSALCTADTAGRVRCFDAASSYAVAANFVPDGGAHVAAAFVGGGAGAVVVGKRGGDALQLWTLGSDAPHLDQTLALVSATEPRAARAPRRLAVAGGGAFVVTVAAGGDDAASAALFVAHVDAPSNRADHVAAFAVSQPVHSLAALDAPLDADDPHDAEAGTEASGFEIQVFCVQTRAIQQYFLRPSALYPGDVAMPPATPPSVPPSAPPVTAAALPPPSAAADPLARFAALHLAPSPPPPPTIGAAPASRAASPVCSLAPPPPPLPDLQSFVAAAHDAAAAAAAAAAADATAAGLRAAANLVDDALARAADAESARRRVDGAAVTRAAAAIETAVAGETPKARAEACRVGALEAFRECVRASVVPAIKAAAVAAADVAAGRVEARLQTTLGAVARNVTADRDALARVAAKIDALAAAVAALTPTLLPTPPAAAPAIAPTPSPMATPPPPAGDDVRAACRALAAVGDVDAAVYRAVECSDVDVLLTALAAVGIENVRDARPLPFGQLTLLCLVQQLGTTLSRDDASVATKLDWLQLAVLGLDAGDARIRAYVPEVLRQVKTCLEQLPARTRSAHRAPVSILVRVITSLLEVPPAG